MPNSLGITGSARASETCDCGDRTPHGVGIVRDLVNTNTVIPQ